MRGGFPLSYLAWTEADSLNWRRYFVQVSEPMVRRYLDLLEWFFMARQLQPWHANLKKGQVKSPKVYFRDTGLLHHLLGIRDERDLLTHPKAGTSWEGYVVEEVIKAVEPDKVYFWATHQGAELDLLIFKNGRRLGVECKYADAPRRSHPPCASPWKTSISTA